MSRSKTIIRYFCQSVRQRTAVLIHYLVNPHDYVYMKTDLTSQIKLDRIPRRYYRPENEIERTAVTREEKVNTFIYESTADGGAFLASEIARYIRRFTAERGK